MNGLPHENRDTTPVPHSSANLADPECMANLQNTSKSTFFVKVRDRIITAVVDKAVNVVLGFLTTTAGVLLASWWQASDSSGLPFI